jgi:hypothetical protein
MKETNAITRMILKRIYQEDMQESQISQPKLTKPL